MHKHPEDDHGTYWLIAGCIIFLTGLGIGVLYALYTQISTTERIYGGCIVFVIYIAMYTIKTWLQRYDVKQYNRTNKD